MTEMNLWIDSVTGNPFTGLLLALSAVAGFTGTGKILLKKCIPEESERTFCCLTLGMYATAFLIASVPVKCAPWIFIAIIFIGIVPGTAKIFHAAKEIPKTTLLFILLPLIFFSGILFMPPGEWDECVYQLTVPFRWWRDGKALVYGDLPYSGFPSLPQFLFLPLIALSGVNAAKSLAFLILASSFFALGKNMRGNGVEKGVPVAALMISPTLAMLFFGTYAEAFILPGFLCVLFSGRKEKSLFFAILAGVFAGGCASVKLTGAFAAAGMLIFTFFRTVEKKQWKTGILFSIVFSVSALLFALTFYLRPFLETGNFLYPYYEWIFHTGDRTASEAAIAVSRYHHELGTNAFGMNSVAGFFFALPLLGIPEFKNIFDGSFGYAFLPILFFACAVLFRKRFLSYLAAFVFLYAGWYFTSPQARFLLPGTMILLLCAAHGITLFRRRFGKKASIFLAVIFCVCAVFSIHPVYMRNFATNHAKTVAHIAGKITSSDLLYSFTGDSYAYALHALLEKRGKTLLLFEERTLYLPPECEIATPLFQGKYFTPPENASPEKVSELLKKSGVEYLYVRVPENNPDFNPDAVRRINPLLSAVIELEDRGKLKRSNPTTSSILYSVAAEADAPARRPELNAH